MGYHISTGLIREKFASPCECPLCEIRRKVEENFLHEFLNDAVMEDSTRQKVNEKGFCCTHFDMLYARQNKLSLALQIGTRTDEISALFRSPKNVKDAQKLSQKLKNANSTCIICELVEESMEKYYKTIAQMYNKEKDFKVLLENTNGFCLPHYAELLKYSSYAGLKSKEYLKALSELQAKRFKELKADLKRFCDKHDYRNAYTPLGTAETALPRMRVKLYGIKRS